MKNKHEFIGWMELHDTPDAPDGAWFQMLCDAGEEWLIVHPEKGKDGNDMAHRYLNMTKEIDE